jgi:hypothetical protein
MLKMFNDEMSLAMSERTGIAAGAKASQVELTLRGGEMIRNLGRIVGVWAAKWTGGPALVMAGTGGRLAGKIYERGGLEAIFALVAEALANPSMAKLLLTETARLDDKGRFVFDKRLTEAVRPYQFLAGPRTQVVRVGIEEQREIDKIEREGGPFGIIYDPKIGAYRRQKIEPPPVPVSPVPEPTIIDEIIRGTPTMASRTPSAPARPLVAGSTLAQARPFDRLAARPPQQFAAATPQGAPSTDTATRLDQLGIPLFPAFANEGGLASLQKKPRQMVH